MIAENHATRTGESSEVRCRFCQSSEIAHIGNAEFVRGFNWPIWDCRACGCRFTRHDQNVYDQLHSESGSCYTRYREIAAAIKPLFDRRDRDGLRGQLSQVSKYEFIIKKLSGLSANARLLEIGCARGFLTSYFILCGHDILGIDVSQDAVASANEVFGNHFALAGSAEIEARAPYDAIYHVGTIGCVGDPVGMTEQLLGLLKPGGTLLFNSPNRDACNQGDQLWFESAPPPDVVTLFAPGFWRRRFSKVADVSEEVELLDSDQSFAIGFRKLLHVRWRHPEPLPLTQTAEASAAPARARHKTGNFFERAIRKVARASRVSYLAPRQPSEFGLFVTMKRK